MSNMIFLYRTKKADDRDCCAYIDIEDLNNNYTCCDGKFNIHGACYSASLGGRYYNYSYSEIDTILTEKQYERLLNPLKNDDFSDIIETLTSNEAADFYAEIIASEQEYMIEEYDLDVDDIQDIYNNYPLLNYMDRAIINDVYYDAEDLGRTEIENRLASADAEDLIEYFDCGSFGEDLVNNNECYYELDDGRIVNVNY